jgi:peptidoglycan/LPS O-acetylase OafA/YrhL
MAKPGLGRDLGTLMARNPKEAAAPVGAGVRSLMRGHNPPAAAAAPAPAAVSAPSTPTPAPVIPRWYFFAGDVVLVALALVTIYKSPHPLSWPRELFCAAVVILAAALAVLALLMPDGSAANPSPKL